MLICYNKLSTNGIYITAAYLNMGVVYEKLGNHDEAKKVKAYLLIFSM